jgi:ubiquinone/menaquinone biosynthesis C-methylase UbiE
MQKLDLFDVPLVDLGSEDPRLAGILAPRDAPRVPAPGVTAQFLENAGDYHRRYFDTSYWSLVLAPAFEAIGLAEPPRTILDVGSGSGNSVIPVADRFPEARIVATDVSAPLLAILRDFLKARPDRERFTLVCVDATEARYRPGVVDLAVGAAILHHLLEPERVLERCLAALSPGGWAMFFEPFEAGNVILKIAYQRILAQASPQERESPAMKMLARLVNDYRTRTRPRSDPIYRELDDKWMFTRTYFERLGLEQGWAEVITYALHVDPHGLRKQAEVHLRLGAGLPPEALPAWAWTILDEMDAEMSDDLRGELAQEAAILLRKPG